MNLDFHESRIAPSLFEWIDAFFFMTPLIEDQVAASHRVLDAALEGGVRQIVRLSSRAAGWDDRSELRAWQRPPPSVRRTLSVTMAKLTGNEPI